MSDRLIGYQVDRRKRIARHHSMRSRTTDCPEKIQTGQVWLLDNHECLTVISGAPVPRPTAVHMGS